MSRQGRAGALAVAIAMALATTVCAASSANVSGSEGGGRLTVFAAASLSRVFPQIAGAFSKAHPGASVQFSFAGTDALVAQVEQGAPADVFAGASASYGDRLFAEHLIAPPRAFCTNRLVVVVPPSNPAAISSLGDLARPGVKVVLGAPTVPIGAYARKVLGNLDARYGPGYSGEVLANVVSEEPDVEGVLTKVRLGEADAGFVYETDARSAGSDVRILALPPEAQAVATYLIAVVSASPRRSLAASFVGFVLGPQGQQVLTRAGFGPPPPTP